MISKLSVAQRLTVGFLVVALSVVLVTVLGVLRVDQINQRLATINDNSVKERYAINFRGSVHDRAIAIRDVILDGDTTAMQADFTRITDLTAAYDQSAQKLDALMTGAATASAAEREDYAAIKDVQQRTLPVIDQVIALRTQGKDTQAKDIVLAQARPLFVQWLASINALIDREEAANRTQAAEARSIGQNFLVLMLLICALAVLFALTIAWLITRSITRPMHDAVEVFAAVADGDLTRRLDTASKDGLGEMGTYANAALTRVGEAMSAVADNATQLAATSVKVGTVSEQIGVDANASSAQADTVVIATAEVAHSVQTVAAGSEEMGASIREIGHNANAAAGVASQAVAAAAVTNTTISKLRDSSRGIGDVVKVITTIAEQTNLLALNATIEAARAGEVGRGFAVVAGEVKDLAQETARATEDITRRVAAIQQDTVDAAAAINEVSAVIEQINEYQTMIAAAVEEQTVTTAQMNTNMTQAARGSDRIAENISGVAQATRSTTTSVTAAQQAATELAEVSHRLQHLTDQFTI